MLLLTSTSDLVQVVTSAAADIEAHASWMDNAAGTITPGRTNTASITTATTTTVVGSPAASTQRNVKLLSLRNAHASTSCDVTVEHTDGSIVEALIKVTLLAGEALVFDEAGVWTHYEVSGAAYSRTVTNAGATQAEMVAGTSDTVAVTPAVAQHHPSACKAWGKAAGAGTLTVSYNVTSVTDTGAGHLDVTIAADFSSANYAIVAGTTAVATTLTVATIDNGAIIYSSSQAAGAFGLWNFDHTANTHVVQDPQSYFWACYGDQV